MPKRRQSNCGKCGALKVRIASGATRCPVCHKRWGNAYYRSSADRREKQRRSYLLRTYGLLLEDLERMLEFQDGRCAICRKPWQQCAAAKRSAYHTYFLHHLCVDHDHTTGRVRGLLCNACNTAIGMMEEDAARFLAAIRYLGG